MANNETIQILRTNGITDNNKDVTLLEGQPFYNMQKNYLTIGDKTRDGKKANAEPITVRKLVGYFDDDEGITNSATDNDKYSISPSKGDKSTLLTIENKNTAKIDLVVNNDNSSNIDLTTSTVSISSNSSPTLNFKTNNNKATIMYDTAIDAIVFDFQN